MYKIRPVAVLSICETSIWFLSWVDKIAAKVAIQTIHTYLSWSHISSVIATKVRLCVPALKKNLKRPGPPEIDVCFYFWTVSIYLSFRFPCVWSRKYISFYKILFCCCNFYWIFVFVYPFSFLRFECKMLRSTDFHSDITILRYFFFLHICLCFLFCFSFVLLLNYLFILLNNRKKKSLKSFSCFFFSLIL